MSGAPEDRAPTQPPKRPTPARPGSSPLLPSTSAPMPTAGGKSASPSKFVPKYVPRLIGYDNHEGSEYQDENWRQ